MARLLDARSGAIVIPRLGIADHGIAAARGLLGRNGLEPGEGLLLADPLRCVHTCGMRFPIDVVFLDRALRVVSVARAVPPWRVVWHRSGRHQLEIAAGAADALGLERGRRLLIAQHGGSVPPGSPQRSGDSGGPDHQPRAGACARPSGLPSIPPSVSRFTSQGASPCARMS